MLGQTGKPVTDTIRHMSMRIIRNSLVALVVVALTAACAPSAEVVQTPSPTPLVTTTATATPTPEPDVFTIVVLGDSRASEKPVDCSGCTSFVQQLAVTLKGQLGEKIEVVDHTQPGTDLTALSLALGRDDAIKEDLEAAEIVIVSVGREEGPPWEGEGCPGGPATTPREQLAVIATYTPACITETITIFGERYSDLFDTIATLSPDAESRLAMTLFNSFLGNPEYGTIDAATTSRLVSIVTEWNKAQCDAAKPVGFTCLDVYRAINGATGRTPGGALLSPDHEHFSQAGHDALATLITRAS